MSSQHCFTRNVSIVLLALAAGANAQNGSNVADERIQANVLHSLSVAPDLATESISINTNAGVVTLSGSVNNETQRNRADQLVATIVGVRRVIDQLAVTNGGSSTQAQALPGASNPVAQGGVLQSDGTYTTSPDGSGANSNGYAITGQQNPAQQGVSSAQPQGENEVPPSNGPNTDAYGRPLNSNSSAANSAPSPSTGYPNAQPGSSQQSPSGGQYGQPRGAYQPYPPSYGPPAGQPGGSLVNIPSGAVLRVRVNQHLSSRDVNIGTPFDAMIVNDIIADGQVAIPRGTFVQGSVIEAVSSGHLKGRGELGLQLNQVTLGARVYPLASDVFTAHGGDKTIQTVNSAVGLGALGAIFGAVAGGGVGAAVGAGAGGALGLGASAASGRGDVFLPSETVLTFRLTQPTQVTTVSQAEMQRLASGVPRGEGGPQVLRRYPYPYYGPVVYPRYYYGPFGRYPY